MPAPAHLAAIEALLDQVHEYFLVRLPQHVRQMYARDLCDYPLEQLRWAVDTYRTSPPPLGHKKVAPKPHDIIALLNQELAEKAAADSVASAIWSSIALFGRTQQKAAMQRIGDDGQAVVEQMGGWQLLCKTATTDDVNLWNAQLRDKALAVRAQKKLTQQLAALRQASLPQPRAQLEAAHASMHAIAPAQAAAAQQAQPQAQEHAYAP